MKTILFYDSETNGLPVWDRPSGDPCQPRITQLAAQLCVEETGKPLAAMDLMIRPDGWTIPEDIQEMTGITMDRAERFGVPVKAALDGFLELWCNSNQRSGHNESFDMRMVRIEIMRCPYWSGEAMQTGKGEIPFADYWKAAPAFCTQSNSTKIVNAARTTGEKKKTASLAEAYKHFTGLEITDAHSAWADLIAAKAVYYGIKAHNAQLAAA